MRFSLIASVFCCLIGCQMSQSEVSDAQVVGRAIHDYWLDKPFQYKPSDPWVRGRIFQAQTGHYGRFYNCDYEECKRNSPYICWKVHYEKDIPPRRGIWGGLKDDFASVTQRIRDGACGGDNCTCSDCRQVRSPHPHPQGCGCGACKTSPDQNNAVFAQSNSPSAKKLPNVPAGNRVVEQPPTPKFGLVSSRRVMNQPVGNPSAPTDSIAQSAQPSTAQPTAIQQALVPSQRQAPVQTTSPRTARRKSIRNYLYNAVGRKNPPADSPAHVAQNNSSENAIILRSFKR